MATVVKDGSPPDPSSLVAWLERALSGRRSAAGVGVVADGVSLTATIGSGADDDFEIGSISKAITGLLYACSLTSGVVEPGTRLGDLVDVGAGPVGAITLADLATHHSGLPRLPAGMHQARRTWNLMMHGVNPYGDSLQSLLEQASATAVGRPRFRYSNMGFELLGHAIAFAHGMPFPDLLRVGLSEPVGMTHTYSPSLPTDLSFRAVVGQSRGGRLREPWTGEALAPAGGVRASVADMTTLMRALLDGTAPGILALDPVAPVAGPGRIGAAWLTVPWNGSTLTWHNGRTGGFASWIGLDRARGLGAVVLSATSRSVDRLGQGLLDWAAATPELT